jgi:hypothetical protein
LGIFVAAKIGMMEFLFLHLSASNRKNIGLEPLSINPCPKHFGMSSDGNVIACVPNVLPQLTCL